MTQKTFLSALLLSGAALAPVNGSLIAYYPLDGDFLDASGNGNDGTMFGGVTYAADAPAAIGGGQSAAFDGAAGTYGAVGDGLAGSGLGLSMNTNFSVSMWVKGDGTANSDDRIFSEGSTANANPLFNVGTHNNSTNGTVDIYVRNGGGPQTFGHAYSPGTAFDNTWHHVLVSGGSDGLLDLYIDGVFDNTFNYTNVPTFTNLDTTSIGGVLRTTDCCNFLGSIDDVSFWDQDLSAAEISALASGAAANAIPEPSSALLSLAGLLIVIRRRR